MNPQEFAWTEDQQVTVTNPTTETFKWKVHNKEYELGAGKTAKMPGYIAWVYVYGQAVKKVQADGFFNCWNEEDFRPSYYDQFVVGADQLVQTVEEVQTPLVEELDDEPESPEESTDQAPELPQGNMPAVNQDDEPTNATELNPGVGQSTVPAVAPMQPAKKAGRRAGSARV